MHLITITNTEDLNTLIEYIKDFDFISYDSETTGLTKRDQVIGFSICCEEDKAFYVILSAWQNDKLEEVVPKVEATRLIQALVNKNLIMHNGTFDCMMAEAFFGISLIPYLHTDTMILAHLLNENRPAGLKELAAAYFGESSKEEQRLMKESVLKNGGKLTKTCYELYKADAVLMAKYGAQDALLTLKLFYTLVPELYEQGLDKFFYEEESMPLLRGPTYELNTTGLKVDEKALLVLKKTLEAECLEAKEFIYKEIHDYIKDLYPGDKKKNTFNIGSSSQLAWLLFGKLQLEFNVLTDEGKNVCKNLGMRPPYTITAKRDFIYRCETGKGTTYSPEGTINGKKIRAKKVRNPWSYIACDKKTLTKYATKFEWIAKLLEYQRKLKILNTYVEGIGEKVQYGVISPSFLQHGTTSGRYSSRYPNFQNLPRDDKRVKECIIARPGKTFVGADYSQLEPRVFAFFSKDKRLQAAFNSTEDFYSVIGMEVYDKFDCTPHKDGSPDAFGIKYKKYRDFSKVIALASTYGATAWQLAPTTGKSIEATQNDIDAYFERFPDVKQMMLDSHKQAKTDGQVVNLFGRPRRIPDAKKIEKLYGDQDHADLPYEARQLLNLAVNHRIQSTGASIVNRSAIKFHEYCKQAGIKCQLVVQVHDSLVVECDEKDAEDVSLLLQEAMENTVHLEGVRLEAKPIIGINLAKV